MTDKEKIQYLTEQIQALSKENARLWAVLNRVVAVPRHNTINVACNNSTGNNTIHVDVPEILQVNFKALNYEQGKDTTPRLAR